MAKAAAGARSLPGGVALSLEILLLPFIVGSALLWVAMLYFWFGFDQSPWVARSCWFVALYFLFPFGPALYCFLVYRRLAGQERAVPAQIA